MEALSQTLLNWYHSYENIWVWVGGISLLFFVGSILALPWMVSQIPHDYFSRPKRPFFNQLLNPLQFVMLLLKNILGLILIVLGILMLLLPGQGILTILAGVLLADFPGKFAFEKWLVARKGVWDAINWLRAKRNTSPLLPP